MLDGRLKEDAPEDGDLTAFITEPNPKTKVHCLLFVIPYDDMNEGDVPLCVSLLSQSGSLAQDT